MSPPSRHMMPFIKLGVGIFLFLVVVVIAGDMKDARHLLDFNWYHSWQVVVWTLLINLLATWRWSLLMTGLSLPAVPFIKLLKVVFIGRVVGHSTSHMLGDIGSRFTYLKIKDFDMKRGTFTILLDKLLEAILLLAIGGVLIILLFSGTLMNHESKVNPLLYFLAPFIFLIGIRTIPFYIAFITKYVFKKTEFSGEALSAYKNTRYSVAALTLGKYLAVVFRFMAIFGLCGIGISYDNVFLGTAVAQAGMIIGITPGGLGFVEVGWAGALHFFEISSGQIVKFLVVQRLLIFISVALLASITLLLDKISSPALYKKDISDIKE
jgi:uncharacterized membrane protein YbhN (UPF0104 family)